MRQLYGAIHWLPVDSAYSRSRSYKSPSWTGGMELGAQQVDLAHVLIRIMQHIHFKDPPTDAIPRVARPFDEEGTADEAVPLAAITGFLED